MKQRKLTEQSSAQARLEKQTSVNSKRAHGLSPALKEYFQDAKVHFVIFYVCG
jgi:hypothetical protein